MSYQRLPKLETENSEATTSTKTTTGPGAYGNMKLNPTVYDIHPGTGDLDELLRMIFCDDDVKVQQDLIANFDENNLDYATELGANLGQFEFHFKGNFKKFPTYNNHNPDFYGNIAPQYREHKAWLDRIRESLISGMLMESFRTGDTTKIDRLRELMEAMGKKKEFAMLISFSMDLTLYGFLLGNKTAGENAIKWYSTHAAKDPALAKPDDSSDQRYGKDFNSSVDSELEDGDPNKTNVIQEVDKFFNLGIRDKAYDYDMLHVPGYTKRMNFGVEEGFDDPKEQKKSAIHFKRDGKDVYMFINMLNRVKWAAELYHEGKAPFIMVSGADVWPKGTDYTEAELMRDWLTGKLKSDKHGIKDPISVNKILVDGYARHSTTNLRNAYRYMEQYGMTNALIVTDPKIFGQAEYFAGTVRSNRNQPVPFSGAHSTWIETVANNFGMTKDDARLISNNTLVRKKNHLIEFTPFVNLPNAEENTALRKAMINFASDDFFDYADY